IERMIIKRVIQAAIIKVFMDIVLVWSSPVLFLYHISVRISFFFIGLSPLQETSLRVTASHPANIPIPSQNLFHHPQWHDCLSHPSPPCGRLWNTSPHLYNSMVLHPSRVRA